MKEFIISDLHFDHKNILKYTDRSDHWDTVEEMNEGLIEIFNSVVGPQDVTYILGDFCFGSKEAWASFASRLNGTKHIILGNHDERHKRPQQWFHEVGFEEVYRHSIILHRMVILSHEPVYLTLDTPLFNIHGHTHGRNMDSSLHYNVSCDALEGYKPVELSPALWDKVSRNYRPQRTIFNDIVENRHNREEEKETVMKHTETDEYYIFEGNLRYSKDIYSLEEAANDAKTMENCKDCTNCRDCKSCTMCEDCSHCSHCHRCHQCHDCRRCFACNNCDTCTTSEDCTLCSVCSASRSCMNCYDIRYCVDCTYIRSCSRCADCESIESVSGATGIK